MQKESNDWGAEIIQNLSNAAEGASVGELSTQMEGLQQTGNMILSFAIVIAAMLLVLFVWDVAKTVMKIGVEVEITAD